MLVVLPHLPLTGGAGHSHREGRATQAGQGRARGRHARLRQKRGREGGAATVRCTSSRRTTGHPHSGPRRPPATRPGRALRTRHDETQGRRPPGPGYEPRQVHSVRCRVKGCKEGCSDQGTTSGGLGSVDREPGDRGGGQSPDRTVHTGTAGTDATDGSATLTGVRRSESSTPAGTTRTLGRHADGPPCHPSHQPPQTHPAPVDSNMCTHGRQPPDRVHETRPTNLVPDALGSGEPLLVYPGSDRTPPVHTPRAHTFTTRTVTPTRTSGKRSAESDCHDRSRRPGQTAGPPPIPITDGSGRLGQGNPVRELRRPTGPSVQDTPVVRPTSRPTRTLAHGPGGRGGQTCAWGPDRNVEGGL